MRTFPDVGFNLRHLSDGLPVNVRTYLNIKLGDRELGPLPERGHYAGEKLWRLNPRFAHKGHFTYSGRGGGQQGTARS